MNFDFIKNLFNRLREVDSTHFLRIYLQTSYYTFFLVPVLWFMGFSILISILICILISPFVSLAIFVFTNAVSSTSVDFLYGMGRTQDNSEIIRNSEILKIIPLKEQEKYVEFIKALNVVEVQFGTSFRIVYYRAISLIELNHNILARRAIKNSMLSDLKKDPDDAFYGYCRELMDKELHPERLVALKETEECQAQSEPTEAP